MDEFWTDLHLLLKLRVLMCVMFCGSRGVNFRMLSVGVNENVWNLHTVVLPPSSETLRMSGAGVKSGLMPPTMA